MLCCAVLGCAVLSLDDICPYFQVNQAIAGSVWVIGPAVGGILAETYGYQNSFIIAGIGSALCSLGYSYLPETLNLEKKMSATPENKLPPAPPAVAATAAVADKDVNSVEMNISANATFSSTCYSNTKNNNSMRTGSSSSSSSSSSSNNNSSGSSSSSGNNNESSTVTIEPKSSISSYFKSWKSDVYGILSCHSQRALIAVACTQPLRFGCFTTAVALHASQITAAGPKELGFMFTALALSQGLGMPFGAWLADKSTGSRKWLVRR